MRAWIKRHPWYAAWAGYYLMAMAKYTADLGKGEISPAMWLDRALLSGPIATGIIVGFIALAVGGLGLIGRLHSRLSGRLFPGPGPNVQDQGQALDDMQTEP